MCKPSPPCVAFFVFSVYPDDTEAHTLTFNVYLIFIGGCKCVTFVIF